MRNPDDWRPSDPSDQPRSPRRIAVFALIVVALLVAGGLYLSRTLRGMSQVQDCALSGRSNCE